jgi:hypothetical protein
MLGARPMGCQITSVDTAMPCSGYASVLAVSLLSEAAGLFTTNVARVGKS